MTKVLMSDKKGKTPKEIVGVFPHVTIWPQKSSVKKSHFDLAQLHTTFAKIKLVQSHKNDIFGDFL